MMTEQRPVRSQRRVPVQRHHWAPVLMWAAISALVVWLGAALAQATHAATWTPASAAALAGGAATVMVAVATGSAGLATVAAATTAVVPGWLAWVMLTSRVYTAPAVTVLVVACGLLACWWVMAWAVFSDDARKADAREARARAAMQLSAWGDLLEKLGVRGVRAVRVNKTANGRTVELRLPDDGSVKLGRLQMITEQVAGSALAGHLRADAVFFEVGENTGRAVLTLVERDYLADAVPLPDLDHTPSISDLLDLGIDGVGREALVRWRDVGCLVTGVMGAGKTNLLHVLLARFTACADTVVFVIDLKGGRLAAPWVKPWVDQECARPAVDWVATTRAEAQVMLRALDAIITARGEALEGGSKMAPSAAHPQYILICDEMADLTGTMPASEQADGVKNGTMAWLVGRIARKQRSEAVTAIWATQRGVAQATGSTELKSQCKVRITLAVTSEAEARTVTDDMAVAKLLPQLQHAGSAVVSVMGDRSPLPVKIYRLDPDLDAPHGQHDLNRIHELARHAGRIRPEPDQVALRAMGTVYTDRWKSSSLLAVLAAQGRSGTGLIEADGSPVPAQSGTGAGSGTGPAQDTRPDAEIFADLMERAGLADNKPDPRARMYALLADKPQFGMGVSEIYTALKREGMPADKSTIHRWLSADIDAGKVTKQGKDKGTRYRMAPGAAPPA